MRTWAIFLYGMAAGMLAAWAVSTIINSPSVNHLLIGSGAILAIGLLVHQRHVSLSKGRRWKKTT